jgi:hypothetical protein
MEIVAHGLWAAAAAITAKRSAEIRVHVGWTVWWTAFPDVLAFGPPTAAGLWLRLSGAESTGPPDGHTLPHVSQNLLSLPTSLGSRSCWLHSFVSAMGGRRSGAVCRNLIRVH